MKVTQVAIRPTPASDAAGRPSLTPELLAASGARYSRSNEGLDAILSRIDPDNLDKSVDGIFKMIDYGHQSIADMAPVAMFIDGVSIWLAYHVWTLCPTAGGQESSTRYIPLGVEGLIPAEQLGIPDARQGGWLDLMQRSFAAYTEALSIWSDLGESRPELTRIPPALLADQSEKAQRQITRMRRNYAFDRARYFLPAAASTNMMLVMSARAWVQLTQNLLAHPCIEAQALGSAVRDELGLAAPRLLRHAVVKDYMQAGIRAELALLSDAGDLRGPDADMREHPSTPRLEVHAPDGTTASDIAAALKLHPNRYAWFGSALQRTQVRFSWEAIALAEIRDLNRHRTGTKYCPLVPRGFYWAEDEWPPGHEVASLIQLRSLSAGGREASAEAWHGALSGDPECVYWGLLGTQYYFEHTTTADKFIYEAELRTGTGAHYRYARHLHDALELWYKQYPQTRGLVLEGSAEPE